MAFPSILGLLLVAAPQVQESVMPPPPRRALPRPVAGAVIAETNDNRRVAGRLVNGTLTVSLDVVEAAYQPDGEHDPVVRALAFAETGKTPQVPGPLLRAPLGTTVHLTVRNRTDSALVIGGLRRTLPANRDTLNLAAGETREITFRLEATGNFFYWAMLKGLSTFEDRFWLDSQLTGAMIVDAPGVTTVSARERVWLITEWFQEVPEHQSFESALVFNGKAWPHNERLTFAQGDSITFRVINAAAIEHPLHLHGFYFRVPRQGGARADTVVPVARQALQNMHLMPIGGSATFSFAVTTPGNWLFHCHFAGHVGDHASLHGSPDAYVVKSGGLRSDTPSSHAPQGHTMRGLVIGMHVTPAPDYREPTASKRRTLNLLIQQRRNALLGGQTAIGFVLQKDDKAPAPDSVLIPGPVLELQRGQPVRIVVKNNLDEPSGVHWHGLEIESFPDGVPGFSGIGDKIMPPIPPGGSFAAEFTPPRSGTFPYHSHLHELRQIGSGMYGAIIVSDTPRDTTRDHLVVAGGGGLPMFHKQDPTFLLVNGRRRPAPLRMTVGDTNRVRIVSIHADFTLHMRLGTEEQVARWKPIARDGADLPPALRAPRLARMSMGPGETADFEFVPTRPGEMLLEVWIERGQRIALPIIVQQRQRR